MTWRLAFAFWGGVAVLLSSGSFLMAAPIEVAESATNNRPMQVRMQVTTKGKVITIESPGKTRDLPIDATATFQFTERRLPSAGRDALAFRAAREFSVAKMRADVQGQITTSELPATSNLVVTNGRLSGFESYSFRTLLTHEQIDLLNLPADPLSLVAALPSSPVDVGTEWTIPQWAAQLVAGVEAIESSQLTGKVLSTAGGALRIEVTGDVQGLQEGARTSVTIQGEITYDVAAAHIRFARMKYTIQAGIGAVSPGIDAEVVATVERTPAADPGRLTDEAIATLPLEAPPQALQIAFNAPPWGVRLRHPRGWYVFHAVLDAPPRVAILRLVENGSLICQCNLSPIPDAAPGKTTPVEQFEQDIQMSLKSSFRNIKSRDVTPSVEGRTVTRVIALGEVEMQGADKEGKPTSLAIPMEWRYYIVADRSGRQVSFVFSVEQALVEQLGDRDRQIVNSLEFLPR